MIRYNQVFKDNYLADLESNIALPFTLLELINDGFVKHSDGCVFFKKLQPHDSLDKNNNFFDKTEIECWYNEIRFSDYAQEYLNLFAPKFAFEVLKRLNEVFSDLKFEIIISYDIFESDLDITMKLHTIRKDEVPYIDIDILDDYVQPILVIRN